MLACPDGVAAHRAGARAAGQCAVGRYVGLRADQAALARRLVGRRHVRVGNNGCRMILI